MSSGFESTKEIFQIKTRSLGVMFFLIVLFVAAYILIDYFKTRSELVAERQKATEKVVNVFESEKARLVSFFSTRVKCHLASPLAIEAMESQDNEQIYQVAKRKFDILNSRNPYVTHMHFYAPDGTSLMRVHNKEVFGDKIADKRPMVAYAVSKQASVSGFEEGYFGLIFRIVEPAYNEEGEYIGSLEFGLQPQYFETVIKGLFADMKVAMAISKDHLTMYQDSGRFESYNNHYLIGDDVELLKPFVGKTSGEQQTTVKIDNKSYVLVDDIVLDDFAGKPFIQMYLLKNVQELQDTFVDTVYFSLIMGLLLLLFIWLAIQVVFERFTNSVVKLSNALADSHAKMESTFNAMHEGVAVLDFEGNFVEVNRAFVDIVEVPAESLLEMTWKALFPELNAGGKPLNISYSSPNGDVKSLELVSNSMESDGLFLLVCSDVTQLRRQQVEIENYIKVVDENVITSKTDANGIITYASQAFCETSGYSSEELIGQNHSIVRHPDMPKALYQEMWRTITKGQIWQGEIKNLSKDGSAYWVWATISPDWDDQHNIIGYTAIRNDITDKKRVETLSITDELTGLYNRRYYNMVFDAEYTRCKRENRPFLFILIDLDHFKRYNDTYGHQKGDEVLEQFAACLKTCFKRSGDILFRLGGEEFAAILNIKEPSQTKGLMDIVNDQLEQLHIEHSASPVKEFVTVSIGGFMVTDFTHKYLEEDIYRMADEALYEAKSQGRNRAVLKQT